MRRGGGSEAALDDARVASCERWRATSMNGGEWSIGGLRGGVCLPRGVRPAKVRRAAQREKQRQRRHAQQAATDEPACFARDIDDRDRAHAGKIKD